MADSVGPRASQVKSVHKGIGGWQTQRLATGLNYRDACRSAIRMTTRSLGALNGRVVWAHDKNGLSQAQFSRPPAAMNREILLQQRLPSQGVAPSTWLGRGAKTIAGATFSGLGRPALSLAPGASGHLCQSSRRQERLVSACQLPHLKVSMSGALGGPKFTLGKTSESKN